MSSLNKVMLIGRLGQDPEVRYLENGAAVAKFSIATTESYKDKAGEWQDQTEWHNIIMWRALAERAEKSLSKGKLIYIEGKLTHRSWQDKEGNNRRTTEVVANLFRMLEKRNTENSGNNFPTGTDQVSNAKPVENVAAKDSEGDDLPF